MKILILGHYEIASNYAISLLVEHLLDLSTDIEINIALSGSIDSQPATDKGAPDSSQNQDLVALGEYEKRLCNELNTGHDSLNLGSYGFNQLAVMINNRIGSLENPNSQESIAWVRALNPTLIISIRYQKILHDTFISIPKQGIINLHSGVLPNYRGVMATFWSMLNNEPFYGTTLHRITDASIDTGAIITLNTRKLNLKRTYLENILALYPEGVGGIITFISDLTSNSSIDVQIVNSQGVYYSTPTQEDVHLFKKKALRLY